MAGWFDIDKEGMSRVLERRGKHAAILELVQNGWDEVGVTRVAVELKPVAGKALADFRVQDDAPAGFSDLAYAFTLFKSSAKARNPEQRGRFAIGEKLVFALCDSAEVSSTKGTVVFSPDGQRREYPRRKRDAGSVVSGQIRMTREELAEALTTLNALLVPEGIVTTVNGELVEPRHRAATFRCQLRTEIADDEGYLRPAMRHTDVHVYAPLRGETASVYELGIPVVETGDRWHLDVQQKVPVSLDRSGLVSAAYLRDLRAHALNATAGLLSEDEASATWVTDALEDPEVTAEAVSRTLDLRYGERRVVYDPSDHEANRIAVSSGYTVIPSRAMSKEAWANVREHEAALPAGRVTPSPKPFTGDGAALDWIPEDDWSDAERNLVRYAQELHQRVIKRPLTVKLTRSTEWGFNGTYGAGGLTINLSSVRGRGPCLEVDSFLIHEFAHSRGGHLTQSFDAALSDIGAAMVDLARTDPEFFERYDLSAVTV